MNSAVFDRLREIAHRQAGIALSPAKKTLVQGRIGRRCRELALTDPADYLAVLEGEQGASELMHFLDAIATNHTSFMREVDHFRRLEREVLERLRAGATKLRIWSAACSTGEEPYSIGCLVLDLLERCGRPTLDFKILATDISTQALGAAAKGCYDRQRVEPLGRYYLTRFFENSSNGGASQLRVKQCLRDTVLFRRLNLAQPPFPLNGPIDFIFCRNVMIYFDRATRLGLGREIYRLLSPKGLLMIGHAESLSDLGLPFCVDRPSIYRRAPERGAR
ncbi:MAG: chemotaxis protein CheR [Deltaproteobacteria bacterium]|nr:chemotaxis protein CheR [Deltaproteobacteria bacterium]